VLTVAQTDASGFYNIDRCLTGVTVGVGAGGSNRSNASRVGSPFSSNTGMLMYASRVALAEVKG